MTLELEGFKLQWSSMHGNADTSGIVGLWLAVSFRCARVCTFLRITPNSLTLLGVVSAVATAIVSPHLWSVPFLALSLIFDGVDGSVAIIQKRVSSRGAIWDAIADRISEICWAIAFYRIGIPLLWILAAATVAAIQEYARARLSAAGVKEVGVVTPAERPVRASFLFCALIVPHAFSLPLLIALVFLQGLSFILVLRFAFSKLH
ncbi:unannotated protein [freshwater metagenome]|uniref:Unannotated protein n=1 Tax=freshwater metagenome TaxID=449393 RepID=A0A6J7DCF0_9ZZZZ|nr:hypothetical protein [Actinomycetota bacterium]MSW26827.1 hypothetical protein [Actinomycetota bacterium]MSW33709.1 hypothetical protein [Actinomycetota bacterium]MSX31248.1 hypothetical protein [Actinomycetota bacterium]MSX52189.1 hypothetical protein [Actinomycetota bacterium]